MKALIYIMGLLAHQQHQYIVIDRSIQAAEV